MYLSVTCGLPPNQLQRSLEEDFETEDPKEGIRVGGAIPRLTQEVSIVYSRLSLLHHPDYTIVHGADL